MSRRPNAGLRWCYRCNLYMPYDQFRKAPPDFPTRDGYNFACNSCAPDYWLVRDPITKKVEQAPRYDDE